MIAYCLIEDSRHVHIRSEYLIAFKVFLDYQTLFMKKKHNYLVR